MASGREGPNGGPAAGWGRRLWMSIASSSSGAG